MASRNLLIMVGALAAALIWAASAAAGCNPGRPQYGAVYQSGWDGGPGISTDGGETCISGSLADIYNGDPYVYPSANDVSSVWTMLFK